MKRSRLIAVAFAVLALAPRPSAAQYAAKPALHPDLRADLGIGRGLNSHRPNILVAWRNTERILEVEILVRNLSDQPGHGTVHLEIANEVGKTLLATEPFPVTVPARNDGGEQGTVVQTKGFRLMNLMFDELDRLDQRYKLRAIVHTDGDDRNLLDNVATKAFNVDNRALPGGLSTYRYRLENTTSAPVTGRVFLDNTVLPEGWVMNAEPAVGTEVTLAPNQVFTGYLTVRTPQQIKQGDYVDMQVGLAERADGSNRVIDSDEWFLVATDQPPQVDEPTLRVNEDGSVTVNVAAYDPLSGIKEASGVQVAYSLDHGTTFSTRVLAYSRGDFYTKTWFEGTLGPFAPGVNLSAVLTVSNNAGIIRRFNLPNVTIPGQQTARPETAHPQPPQPPQPPAPQPASPQTTSP